MDLPDTGAEPQAHPPGPLPAASATSTPASRASFRAYGLATTRPPAEATPALVGSLMACA